MMNFAPLIYEFAPGRFFNARLLVSIQSIDRGSTYQYSFIGPQLINLSPKEHFGFIEFYKDHLNFFTNEN